MHPFPSTSLVHSSTWANKSFNQAPFEIPADVLSHPYRRHPFVRISKMACLVCKKPLRFSCRSHFGKGGPRALPFGDPWDIQKGILQDPDRVSRASRLRFQHGDRGLSDVASAKSATRRLTFHRGSLECIIFQDRHVSPVCRCQIHTHRH